MKAKFTYSPLGKSFEKQVNTIKDHGKKQVEAFEKQLKTIEDQGQKEVEALKDLKPKAINDKSEKKKNLPRSKIIFNNLINERKNRINKFYESADYNNLKFEYVGPTKNASFYEYMDSKKLFNAIKNNQLKFDDALKR